MFMPLASRFPDASVRQSPSRDRRLGLLAGIAGACHVGGMVRITKLLLMAVLLVGCALREETDEFVGEPVSAVTAKLGIPAEEQEIGGARLYIWSSAKFRDIPQGGCTIRAIVGGDVIGSFVEGTEGECANYALMLKGSGCRKGMPDVRMWLPSCIDGDKSQ
jgi:hypothetical protein